MAAPAIVQPPSGPHSAIAPKILHQVRTPVKEPSSPEVSDGGDSIFKVAYRYVCLLGKRWKSFGKKFRAESVQPDSNWVERKTSKNLDDFRRMW